jgi:hypothetical protein
MDAENVHDALDLQFLVAVWTLEDRQVAFVRRARLSMRGLVGRGRLCGELRRRCDMEEDE